MSMTKGMLHRVKGLSSSKQCIIPIGRASLFAVLSGYSACLLTRVAKVRFQYSVALSVTHVTGGLLIN
eukprot:scaffold559769_cov21-Prasinocladus_malaysianus.AAC.1